MTGERTDRICGCLITAGDLRHELGLVRVKAADLAELADRPEVGAHLDALRAREADLIAQLDVGDGLLGGPYG